MFEDDQEILSKWEENKEDALSPVLTKSINRIIQNAGYMTYSIFVRNISTEGGNYMSLLKEVDIKGRTINSNKVTNLFIKHGLPESEKNIISTKELFLNEIFIYTELAELLKELQNEFNVPDKEKYNFVEYYDDGNNDFLIFDNMVKKGYKIYNRFEVTPLKALELSVKELAKFHGFSMILKQYRPEFYRTKIQRLKNNFVFNDNGEYLMKSVCKISLECMEDDRKIKLEKFLPGLYDKFYRYINENEGKVKCLCHGDYRMNNILVKETNAAAARVIPIDYQAIHYGSPVTDLLYVIFMSTDRQFRKEHMENLKKTYFKSLTKFLRYFDIDIESIYPEKDFVNDFNNQLEYGLIISLVVLPFVLASKDDVPELNIELKKIKFHDNFKSRIEEIVDDFIEWGYL